MPRSTRRPPAPGRWGHSDLSGQPGQQRRAARKAPARRRKHPPESPPAGPGGLGYILSMDEEEKAQVDWHGEGHETPLPATPPRR